jgi:hypothetical protein
MHRQLVAQRAGRVRPVSPRSASTRLVSPPASLPPSIFRAPRGGRDLGRLRRGVPVCPSTGELRRGNESLRQNAHYLRNPHSTQHSATLHRHATSVVPGFAGCTGGGRLSALRRRWCRGRRYGECGRGSTMEWRVGAWRWPACCPWRAEYVRRRGRRSPAALTSLRPCMTPRCMASGSNAGIKAISVRVNARLPRREAPVS